MDDAVTPRVGETAGAPPTVVVLGDAAAVVELPPAVVELPEFPDAVVEGAAVVEEVLFELLPQAAASRPTVSRQATALADRGRRDIRL